MDFHQYAGVRIPVMTGKSARAFYNLPDSEIDKLRCGTNFDDDGRCLEQGFGATPFEDRFKYLDEKQIREQAEFLERESASIFALFREHNVPVKNQNGHGYCWGYGTETAREGNWLVRNKEYIEFNPHSVCAPVKNGRDQGGWGSDYWKYAHETGVLPASVWKGHDRDFRSYDTPENNALRAKYRHGEAVELPRGDMHALQSVLASNFGAGVGLMWWGHLVGFLGLSFSDKHGPLYLFRNSHGPNFGVEGWCFATEPVATHGGGTVILTAT